MSDYLHKSHNVTVLLYHFVFPAKYRRAVFDKQVDEVLKTLMPTVAHGEASLMEVRHEKIVQVNE